MNNDKKILRLDFDDFLETEEEKKKKPLFATQRGHIISFLVLIVIVAAFAAMRTNGFFGTDTTYAASDTEFAITYLEESPLYISYDDISEIRLLETLPMDEVIESTDWDSGWIGIYANEELGEYRAYVYSKSNQYIAILYNDGVVVYNAKNNRETKKEYESLLKKWSQYNNNQLG